ncbi:MAG: MG2 domain-containing protein [Candidatus Gracilibacteria bacterium]|nr:MG2 domain-containing protein [Candidatus Gracilibacteria bacterium]
MKNNKRWYAGIKGFCEHSTDEFKFTNALTEGINNLCKVAKRVSHGFSGKVMYIKKLTARFCLKNLKFRWYFSCYHEKSRVNNLRSYDFLNDVQVFRNIYSNTGVLVDTKNMYLGNYEYNKYIPVKDIFFNLTFEEEVLLDKKNFSFKDDKGKNIDFNIEYIKEEKIDENNSRDVAMLHLYSENKKKVKLTLKTKLENSKIYNLVVSKKINKYLKEDIIKKYNSSKKLEVIDFRVINYGKTCLYLSNQIDNVWSKKDEIFETIPESRINNIRTGDSINYNIRQESDKIKDYNTKKEFLLKKGYCVNAKSGEYLYVLNTRLNPNSWYELKIQNTFEDKYGNKLGKVLSKKIKTENIAEKDKYLYSSTSKSTNVIPDNLPIVINLKTINLDKVNLEVCEMDENGYMDYANNRGQKGFSPKCINSKSGEVIVKNNYWNLTNNKIDLEEDFLKQKFSSNFILIKGRKINSTYGFENIYIRENISLTYENASNKKLLFVTDYKANQLTNVEFSFYKINYNSKTKTRSIKKVNLTPKLNTKTKVFELDAENVLFDYIVVKNKDSLGILDTRNDYLSNYGFNYISGNSSSQKKFLYLYTERPIYKPGDTVFVKGLLREFKATGYTATDIKKASLELVGPSGKVILTKEIIVGKNSNFDTNFIIPKEVALGKFRFNFKEIDGKNSYIVKNNAYFDIEEYRKPTFKVNVEEEEVSGNYIIGDKLEVIVKPEYYFGGKMINTTGKYSVLTQKYFFDAKDYSDYQFGEGYSYFNCIYWGSCNFSDKLTKKGDFKIDNNGEYKYSFDFTGEKLNGEKIYNFNFDVIDPDTKRTVSKTVSKVLHNTDAYVGLKTKYYNSIKEGIDINAIVLDFEAKPLASEKVKIELIKKDWKSVKKKGVDGIFYNEYALEEKLESSLSIRLFLKSIR